MVVFRWFSFILIVLALMLLGADIVSTREAAGGVVLRSLDKDLLLFGLDAKPWVQATFSAGFASAVLALLSFPAWATLGIVGVVLALIVPGRRKKRESAAVDLHEEH
jgi:hypothetical protein